MLNAANDDLRGSIPRPLGKPPEASRGHALISPTLPLDCRGEYRRLMQTVSHPFNSSQLREWLPTFIGNAKIIGIGESTHGTEEFFKVQADVTRYLIEHERTRQVFLELPTSYGLHAQHLMTQPDFALTAFIQSHPFITWHTKAISDLLTFVQSWNRDHADDKVLVMGVDPQPDGCLELVRAYLKHHGEPISGLQAWCTQVTQLHHQLQPHPSPSRDMGPTAQLVDPRGGPVLRKLAEGLQLRGKELQEGLHAFPLLKSAVYLAGKHLAFCALTLNSTALRRSDVRDKIMADIILEESSKLQPSNRAVV